MCAYVKPLESPNLHIFFLENNLENATKDTLNMNFRNPKYFPIEALDILFT